MEEHCLAQPGWAEAMILAHQGPWAAVGCQFIVANPKSGSSDKTFRMTYGVYIQTEQHRGQVDFVAGQNSSFKRDILLNYDNQLDSMMMADLVLQWRMIEAGHKLFFEPTARIAHRNENTVRRLCPGAFYWNWCFANVRAQVFQWSWAHKAIRIALSPLIPWVRLARKIALVSRLGNRQFLQFLRDLPAILTIDYCSAAGQVIGLLCKIDSAAKKFSYFEINEPRLSRHELA
jgi:GT2 family glycosyltransferase